MVSEEFIEWANKARIEVGAMRGLLNTRIPDDLWPLREHLVKVEAYHARMVTLYADSERFLVDAEEREMNALGTAGGPTSERKLHVKFKTIQERKVRDVLKGFCEGLKYRLMLGMSLMKPLNAEMASCRAVHSQRTTVHPRARKEAVELYRQIKEEC